MLLLWTLGAVVLGHRSWLAACICESNPESSVAVTTKSLLQVSCMDVQGHVTKATQRLAQRPRKNLTLPASRLERNRRFSSFCILGLSRLLETFPSCW